MSPLMSRVRCQAVFLRAAVCWGDQAQLLILSCKNADVVVLIGSHTLGVLQVKLDLIRACLCTNGLIQHCTVRVGDCSSLMTLFLTIKQPNRNELN